MKVFKNMLEHFMVFLQSPKQRIFAVCKDRLETYEKQIVSAINLNRPILHESKALPPQNMQSQQPHSQSHDNQMSSQMQTGNMQGSMGGMQQNYMGSMQQNFVSSLQGSSNTPQNIINSLQQVSDRFLLQNAVSGPEQVNMNPMSSHSGMGTLQPNSNMIDRIAGSAPGNESRAAIGENLVAMTKSRLQARTLDTQDGTNGVRKMKHCAMPLNVLSPAIKRRRVETNHGLLEEIKEIKRELIDTVVIISEEDVDPTAASEGGDGTVVKCSFSVVTLGLKLKSQYASPQMSPIQPLRLLVPANYPNCYRTESQLIPSVTMLKWVKINLIASENF